MNKELAKLKKINEKNVFNMLRPFIKRSKPVRFEGNNYSDEWKVEAEKRGLSNWRTTPEALSVWEDEDSRQFINKSGILNMEEMDAHLSVRLEHYSKSIEIEANLVLRMLENQVLPPAFRYQARVAEAIESMQRALKVDDSPTLRSQRRHLQNLADQIAAVLDGRQELASVLSQVHMLENEKEEAMAYAKQVLPVMADVRKHCDSLEAMVDANDWELPTYHELLFIM